MARKRQEEPEEEDQEMEEEEEQLVSLQFNEQISWRAGKPIGTGTLISRLEKLSKELVDMDQDTVDKGSLTKVAKDLASHNLLAHKDSGVKAFTAACLVDILKLCAPDAPFSTAQLRDIFTLIVKVIFPALWDPSNAYNTQHKYVLSSLAEVKSILLINELSNAEALLSDLFTGIFDGISGTSKSASGEQVAKDVEFQLTDILVILIDEGASLPPRVLDIMMAQFLRAIPPGGQRNRSELSGKQATLLPKEEPEAYLMAKTVCNTCPEKMARYVSQYFSDVIMDISSKTGHINGHKDDDGSDDGDGAGGPSESDFRELRKAHLLLRELWRAAPTVLQNVIPQVDAELSTDNVQLRLLATETIGDMISGIGAAGPPPKPILDPAAYPPLKISDETSEQSDSSILTTPISPLSFSQTHAQAFHNFESRRFDKSPLIRAAWTTAVGYIVSTSAGGIGLSREDESTFVSGLRDKMNDHDEKVRLAAVKAIEVFSFRDVVTKLALAGGADKESSVLFTLADRCRDKRAPIRVEAMALLAKLWAVGSGELMAGQKSVTSALSSIPTRIFNAFYANDLELNVLLDRVAFEYLVPLSYPPPKSKNPKSNGKSQSQAAADPSYDPDKIRAERILLVARSLDDKAKKAFFAIQTRQPQFSRVLENYVKQCDGYNGGVPEKNGEVTRQNLRKVIQYICSFFPDAAKTEVDLHAFATLNDRRSYQLIRFAVSLESDFKTMHRALKELNKRILASAKPQILETLVPLLYRSAYIMFNKSHLSTFIDYSKNDNYGLGSIAQQITNEISQHIPALFKTHIGQLCKDLIEAAPTSSEENDPALVETLKACSSYSRKYPEELPQDKKFTQALMSYALYGQPPKAAKYAVNAMMARKDEKSMVAATDLLQRIMKVWGYGASHFLNHIAAVSQLQLLAPQVTVDANDDIIDMALDKILKRARTTATAKDPEWKDDSDLEEECLVKCWALKLIVNRVRGVKDIEEAKELVPTVFKLLRTLLKEQGELCKSEDTPKHHKSRLRLLAGQLLLKLCTQKHFEEVFSPADFNRLALLTQDSCAQVRRHFVEKLQKYLVNNKLRPRFYTIIFLTAFEPMSDFMQQTETWIRSRARHFRETKQPVMEAIMARLISLLAHHPDFGTGADDLIDHARYIIYYVSNVATEHNYGLIYKYAERVKQTRDGINPAASDNIYVLSDLAQAVLRKWQERKNWSFQAYSGKFGLPTHLYSALPSHDAARAIAEKQYIPEGVEDRLDDLLRVFDKKKKRKGTEERGESAKRTRTASVAKISAPKASRESLPRRPAVKAKALPKQKKQKQLPDEPVNRRRSTRHHRDSNYVERDDADDDADMLEGVAAWDYYDNSGKLVDNEDDDEDDEEGEKEEEEQSETNEDAAPVSGDTKQTKSTKQKKQQTSAEDSDSEISEPNGDEEEEPIAEEEPENDEEPQTEEKASPPKANGRKGKTAPAPPKAKATRARPAAAKGKAAAAVSKAKTRTASAGRATRGKKVADAYDIDDSD